jgi:hypothetical protein
MAFQNINHLFASSVLNDSALTKTLGEDFVLSDNGHIIFHWADFYETCDSIKSQLESDPSLMEDFGHREIALKRLSLIPVWVRTDSKIHQSTMYDLYEKYILNQTHVFGGVDPFCPLEISFISGTGPFKRMSIAECFNKTTYRDFVLVYLIRGNLPRRDYRIRLKSKILMEYGSDFGQAELVSLEQLTMNGILLSLDSETYMKKIADLEEVRILINTKMLSDAKGKSIYDLKQHLSQYEFNFLYSAIKDDSILCQTAKFYIQSSFDYAINKRVFLFISYDDMAETSPDAVKCILEFARQTKNLVRDHYSTASLKKKTA